MILDLRGPGWRRRRGVAIRGCAFDRSSDRLLDPTALADRLANAIERDRDRDRGNGREAATALDAIATVAAELDGFYAAVLDPNEAGGTGTPDTTVLVADGARTVPLYYGVDDATGDDSRPVVSDRGRVVRDLLDADVDSVTEGEFLLTRYVTGAETIWRGVRSTRAGEVVAVRGDGDVRSITYRDHRPGRIGASPPEGIDRSARTTIGETRPAEVDAAQTRLRHGLRTAFDRLERVAGDRPIVIPLSGGYDSRLVASELVARDREAIAYTFGRSGHPDVEVSREVAARLGIDWEFVPYDADVWNGWYGGPAGEAYEAAAFGGDALPFLAEWPALRTLVAEERIPRDALWCPGHTVATPGERLPAFIDGDDRGRIEPTLDALVDYVRETHYDLWSWEDDGFREAVDERIRRGLAGEAAGTGSDTETGTWIDGPEAAAAAYERWEWRGRMTTFTNGDLRAYEDAGLDWWLPLWDPAYVRAYASLPRRLREDKRLHASLASERYREAADLDAEGDVEDRETPDRAALTDRTLSPVDRHLSLIRHTPIRQFTERDGRWDPPYLAPRSSWGERGSHPLAWNAIVDPTLLERLPSATLYALRTLAMTGRIDLDDPGSLPDDLCVPADDDPDESDESADDVRLRLPTEKDGAKRTGG